MDANKLKTTLTMLGLWKAIKGYPALLILIIASIALLELLAPHAFLLLPTLSGSTFHLAIVIVGTLIGLIGYFSGDFWDSRFFDPHYGIQGKWLHSHTRPFNIFPAGSDLNKYRDKAIQAVFGNEHSGEGLYREAKKIVKKQAKKWEYIEQPLILSKFVRSFIWPCFLISVFSILGAIWSIIFGLSMNGYVFLVFGVITLCFGVLLFIPYFQLRVEHMIRLYEYVDEYVTKKQASQNRNKSPNKAFAADANKPRR